MKLFNWFNKKTNNIIQHKVSKTMMLNTQYGTAHWPQKDYENFAKETYMKNVISFRCIFYISTCIAQVKWGLFQEQGTEREEVLNTPFNKILKRANPQESFVALIQKVISYLLISGNGYLEKVTPSITGVIRELYCLRPDKITLKTNKDTGVLEEFIFDQKIHFPIDAITQKSDILQLKMFHPLDDYFGLSITEPTAREIDSSNEAIEWQKKVFENEGRPGMAVLINGFLSDEQWERMEKQLKEKHGGSSNAGNTIIIEGETTGDVKPYSWSPKEMDWIESNRELARRICLGYGVPPMLLGIPGDNTYSNQQEARAAFWEETIVYFLELLKGELNNWLFEDNLIFIDYDISQVPAMAYKQEVTWNRIKDASFMTLAEKREAVGLEYIEGTDVILIPMGMTTLDQLHIENEITNTMPDENTQQQEEDQQAQDLIDEGIDEETVKQIIGRVY
jgi:HK97 family phage portal protein